MEPTINTAVILAGGLGTRLSEETHTIPKPMVEIGGFPILWHIMKLYNANGITNFIICCGYKGHKIKEYFQNYSLLNSTVTYDFSKNKVKYHSDTNEKWTVTLVDTGLDTMTGGRLKKIRNFIEGDFCMTYGDGLSDINIIKEIDFHNSHQKMVTVCAVEQPGRFGTLKLSGSEVKKFSEKHNEGRSFINGGFFVLSPKVFEYIDDDATSWEEEPMRKLVEIRQVEAFKHNGFWQPMDTLREKYLLQNLWESGNAPWKIW